MSIETTSSNSISLAWKGGLEKLLSTPGAIISPFLFSITVNNDAELEIKRISEILDIHLRAKGRPSNITTANTIFPTSYWNRNLPRTALYDRFNTMWPRIKKCRANRYGHYFQRLISNEIDIQSHQGEPTNQLEVIISNLNNGNLRRSALQAAIFIPSKDLTANRQRGFPCLQHIFFTPQRNSSISLTGIYATQYLFDRGYGNLLGLYNLGAFIEKETGFTLTSVECFVSSLRLGNNITKEYGSKILKQINEDNT